MTSGSLSDDDAIPTAVQHQEDERCATGRFVLLVIDGPDKGRRFVIDPASDAPVLVGQSPACAIRLHDPAASRRHAALEAGKTSLRITDLGSTNGTFVDRVRVVEAQLQGEELVRIGDTTFHVLFEETHAEVPLPAATSFGRVIGASAEMRKIYPIAERLAQTTIPVVIEGETGTGKEVLAESIHEAGPRAGGPFVVFDCTAVPPNLLESELFGHERGAFTGALSTRAGVFEQAHGGTLLIDEIGELDLSLQPKLLRAIERSEVRPIGGKSWIRVDVRVIAATRRDLDREVQAGRFRDDLFHRLAVGRIELPPLRRRRSDIELLARHFWRELGGDDRQIPRTALQRWEDYSWPGNVRELRNAVARRLALGELALPSGHPVPRDPKDQEKGDVIARVLAARLPFSEARARVMQEFEQRYIEQLLVEHGGNVTQAAAASGIGRRYFHKLKARSR